MKHHPLRPFCEHDTLLNPSHRVQNSSLLYSSSCLKPQGFSKASCQIASFLLFLQQKLPVLFPTQRPGLAQWQPKMVPGEVQVRYYGKLFMERVARAWHSCPEQGRSPHPWKCSENVCMRHLGTRGGAALMIGFGDLRGLSQP